MGQRLPWPKESVPFEELCRDLWAAMDPDYRWDLYGRGGQAQRGIDVVGERQGARIGIQCKARDRFLGGRLTCGQVDEEIERAREHDVPLQRLIVATTAPRDARIQDHVARCAGKLAAEGGPSLEYQPWDDLEARLLDPACEDVLAKHFKQFGFRSQRRERIVRYARQITPDLEKLPLRYLRDDDEDRGGPAPKLAQVYTMLDVGARVATGGPSTEDEPAPDLLAGQWSLPFDTAEVDELAGRVEREAAASSEDRDEGYARPATVLEAASVHPRLVLTGVGGSGKTSFLRYLALCLAGENLSYAGRSADVDLDALATGDGERIWNHGMLVPLWVELRDFAASEAFPARDDQATGERLWEYLRGRRSGTIDGDMASDLQDLMAEQYAVPGVLLALDGLDELPDREQQLPLLLAVLEDFLGRHCRCRVLLTARPFALEAAWSRLASLGFATVELAPPSDVVVEHFVREWFAARGKPELAPEMLAQLTQRPRVREVLHTPLMLTMVSDLYESDLRDWTNRADVFDAAIDKLVDRWNAGRGVPGAEQLAPHVEHVRTALTALAWRVFEEVRPDGEAADRWFDARLLEEALEEHDVPHDPETPRYLEDRCGIVESDGHRFRFPHNNVLEFLAAHWAMGRPDAPLPLLERATEDVGVWREVLLFAGALGARGAGLGAWALLDYGLQTEPPEGVAVDDPRFGLAAVLGDVVAENGLAAPPRPADAIKLERLRSWLAACLSRGALAVRDRAAAGRVLALLGDPRLGVGVDGAGVPEIDWVRIEREDGSAFEIARYPITNVQYRAFVDDRGYCDERWADCWTKEGRRWKADRSGPDDEMRGVLLLGNHPRVNVTLHEALAFASWLGRRLGRSVTVPAGEDWVRAANGGDAKRTYPWGSAFDPEACNGQHHRLGASTAVGMFPRGRSPSGVLDLSGNVWEWATRADGIGGDLRGGSWVGDAVGLRADSRVRGIRPVNRGVYLGFRVSAPASR